MEKRLLILSTAYYPPVQYFAEILQAGKLLIEQHETYPRQTYRNRCYIYSANGPIHLSIPVERGSFHRVKLKDIKIDSSRKWQREHINAIESAYKSSAFFEFYADTVLRPLYKGGYEYLLDLNMEILEIMLGILELDISVNKTHSFTKEYADNSRDLRYSLSPKIESAYSNPEYFQVFSPVHGFQPNMSIIDLLFNMGPETWSCLRT
ncbi:MAG: WbqC family protein [Bacteroidales bacterium]|nr:WbqC family protein [Bacteroidales bacterium]